MAHSPLSIMLPKLPMCMTITRYCTWMKGIISKETVLLHQEGQKHKNLVLPNDLMKYNKPLYCMASNSQAK